MLAELISLCGPGHPNSDNNPSSTHDGVTTEGGWARETATSTRVLSRLLFLRKLVTQPPKKSASPRLTSTLNAKLPCPHSLLLFWIVRSSGTSLTSFFTA